MLTTRSRALLRHAPLAVTRTLHHQGSYMQKRRERAGDVKGLVEVKQYDNFINAVRHATASIDDTFTSTTRDQYEVPCLSPHHT